MIKRKTFGIKRIKAGKTEKLKKPKVKNDTWSLKKADKVFSEQIRARDGRCMHPLGTEYCKGLQNSHYIGRVNKNLRYDPENCVAICWFHHFKSKDLGFEYQKQTLEKHGFDGQYTLWMKKHLGEERFSALMVRSKISVKQKVAIRNFQSQMSIDKINE